PRTEVVVTVPLEDRNTARLGWLGSISDRAATLAGCDAGITRVDLDQHGVPTAVSATKRLFTGAVRKAIIVRDQCCIKCGAPASWADCHHIIHHADGGPTILDNGCLLCRSCHTAVHHQGWEVIMGHDRHPWLIPPATIDPRRRPQPAHNRRTLRLDAAA
ncbi:HNH endonuclease, partial [Williamsia sterculiae]